jgi:flagellar basal body rod protein FlgC
MLEPPHLINSLLYVFRPDIGGITPGLFVCCPLAKNLGEVLSAQGKEMREIRSNIAALSTQMAAIMEEVKRNRIDRYRAQSLSPFLTSLRLCILAIRGWLKSRELPLWSLKPPYFPEMTLEDPIFGHSLLKCPMAPREARVCAIGTDRVTDKSLEKILGEVLSAQGKEMSEIKSNIAALSTQMAAQVSRVAPLEFKATLFS